MVYEYSLKVKDVHMTGLRGILTLRGTPVKEIKGDDIHEGVYLEGPLNGVYGNVYRLSEQGYCYVDEQAWEKREIHEDDMLVGMREIAVKVTDEDSGSATVIQYGVL